MDFKSLYYKKPEPEIDIIIEKNLVQNFSRQKKKAYAKLLMHFSYSEYQYTSILAIVQHSEDIKLLEAIKDIPDDLDELAKKLNLDVSDEMDVQN